MSPSSPSDRPSSAPLRRCAALLAAATLALAACDPRPADKPLKPTSPPVPTPSAHTVLPAG